VVAVLWRADHCHGAVSPRVWRKALCTGSPEPVPMFEQTVSDHSVQPSAESVPSPLQTRQALVCTGVFAFMEASADIWRPTVSPSRYGAKPV
jgi:hypothetical protein